MNWDKVYNVLKGVAGLAGLLTFVAFVSAFYKDVQLRQDNVNKGWQEAEIYRVLLETGVDGLSFEDLLREVQTSYFQTGAAAGVDAATAKSDALRRGLVGLSEKNAVTLNNDGTFAVASVPKAYLQQDYLFAVREKCAQKMFNLVFEHPGRYSAVELQDDCIKDGLAAFETHKVIAGYIFATPPVFIPFGDDPATHFLEEVYSPNVKLKVLQ